ncbi:MAG: SpoIIE family protein phosphatase [Bacteroidetes bacterium]|jgi:serine phosphatase RsbU (regulator of sigma subunit)|nr:SpoIIE family protein phosphatase [Bacteroidota bacterium]
METLAETKNFFILYKPKDIVSGDFYHALAHKHSENTNELFYLCTADCTGHGVPGALMSMMGISHLNESIIEKKLVHPNEILDNMRKGIIASLNPEGSDEESKDGMDCVLCAFDFKEMKLEFAGAYNPLWLVRDKILIEYKTDKMPVGKFDDAIKPFSLQSIDLKRGDIIYTFSDGYADQFGGPKGKKFKYKQLQDLLISISDEPMEKQEKILDQKFAEWRENLEQVDDVTVIGVKI